MNNYAEWKLQIRKILIGDVLFDFMSATKTFS